MYASIFLFSITFEANKYSTLLRNLTNAYPNLTNHNNNKQQLDLTKANEATKIYYT